jgi:hypothetical protein
VPIVLLSDSACEAILGVKPRKRVKAPWWSKEKETPDPYDLVDDGREAVADLNYANAIRDEYDLVIDAGTTEHCFNVGQAIVNASGAVKIGGRILHTNPVSMGNHAFYNFCPTLMVDFYQANGFKVEGLELRDDMGEGRLVDFKPQERFNLGNNWAMYCLAKREERKPLKYPIQGKYQ